MNINKGDKVEILGQMYSSHKVGDIGEVMKVDRKDAILPYLVRIGNIGHWYGYPYIKPYTPNPAN